MIVLVDYNLNREAMILSGAISSRGWLSIVSIQFVTFMEMGLPTNSDDRVVFVWQFVQANQMLLLTANRNAKGEDSLERVMREENTPTSLPIITIGDQDRVSEYEYRDACLERLVEIVIDLEDYLGVGRLFIP